VTAVAGLGLFVHLLAHLAIQGGEHDAPLLVEDPHPFDVGLLGHVLHDAVQAVAFIAQHGPEGRPPHRLGEALHVTAGLGHGLAALLIQLKPGGRAHGQKNDQPHRERELEAQGVEQAGEYAFE
jgi:hypothetical protein